MRNSRYRYRLPARPPRVPPLNHERYPLTSEHLFTILSGMENALQFLFLGVIGGGIGYVIASAVQKRRETGENNRSAGGDGRSPDPRRWSAGPGLETALIARLEALERAFQEQNQEITARFNRLAARSRRREPDGEPGPDDAPAQGLTRKQELRSRVAIAKQRTLPFSIQEALVKGGRS